MALPGCRAWPARERAGRVVGASMAEANGARNEPGRPRSSGAIGDLIRQLGKRRSPHHRFPKLNIRTSLVKERRDSSVPRGTGSPHSWLVGPLWAYTSASGATGPRATVDQSERWRSPPGGGSQDSLLVARRRSPRTALSNDPIPQLASLIRRLSSHRCLSNGSPVCITLSKSGTIFRASVHTAFVPTPPLRAFRAR